MPVTCTHLDQIEVTELPEQIAGCEECLKTGDRWVHLRMCMTCGKIGCCDSSPNKHATAHARESEHPISARPSPARTGAGATSTSSRSGSRRGSRFAQVLVHEGDGHAALADRCGDTLDRAEAHVAAREDARHARLEQVRVALELPAPRRRGVGAGEDEAALRIERDLGRQPVRLRVGADEDEQPAGLEARLLAAVAVADVDAPRATLRRARRRSASASAR